MVTHLEALRSTHKTIFFYLKMDKSITDFLFRRFHVHKYALNTQSPRNSDKTKTFNVKLQEYTFG